MSIKKKTSISMMRRKNIQNCTKLHKKKNEKLQKFAKLPKRKKIAKKLPFSGQILTDPYGAVMAIIIKGFTKIKLIYYQI